jgi:uncharacterized membrane protein
MTVLIIIAVAVLYCFWIAAPLFQTSFALLLITPLLWFGVGKFLIACSLSLPHGALAVGLYAILALLLTGALYYAFGVRREHRSIEEYASFLIFAILYCFTYMHSTAWPDFIAMGERLRDYSILASTISSPIQAVEPWMAGAVLNYYVYWYRFGHFLSTVLGMEVWEVYPAMTAFAMALYGAAIFEVSRVALGLSLFISAITSVIATVGSNIAGVIAAYERDSNWWGPSRVVKGAINEFPAWSFILGDLHPHFLNLGLLPLLILVVFSIVQSRSNRPLAAVGLLLIVPVGVLWMFAANAWEVPLWIGILVSLVTVTILLQMTALKKVVKRLVASEGGATIAAAVSIVLCLLIVVMLCFVYRAQMTQSVLGVVLLLSVGGAIALFPRKGRILKYLHDTYSIKDPKLMVVLGFGVVICIILRLSGNHIVPEGGQLTRVLSPIPLTRTPEMLLHWGAPLFFISVGSVLLIPRVSEKCVASVLLFGSLLIDDAAPFLMVLIGLQMFRLLSASKKVTERTLCITFSEGLLLAGIGFLLLPEIVFLNDPYGGENERMNTIFKVYVTTWGVLTVAAASIFTRGVMGITSSGILEPTVAKGVRWVGGGMGIVALGSLSLFFFHAASLRRPPIDQVVVNPRSEGLSELQQRFPGSVEVIRRLREEKSGIVLEAQGNAYDYTTFVSTLSGHTAYLGWANHINLLTKRFFSTPAPKSVGDEVFKREQNTRKVYDSPSCQEKKLLATNEKISFIVLGSKEREKYPGAENTDFSCFEALIKEGQFTLYKVS